MVDNWPVPPNPPDPPKESGPKEGSDEWKVVQSTKDKRQEFGAGVAFPTESKIRHFVLEFRFGEKLDEAVADGSTLNLHGSHREFVEKLMANTGDAQLIPTAKEKKNSVRTTPHPIIAITAIFPRPIASTNSFSIARSTMISTTKGLLSESSMPF
jgi:hypothetical protein